MGKDVGFQVSKSISFHYSEFGYNLKTVLTGMNEEQKKNAHRATFDWLLNDMYTIRTNSEICSNFNFLPSCFVAFTHREIKCVYSLDMQNTQPCDIT